jgi:hypothetical protein
MRILPAADYKNRALDLLRCYRSFFRVKDLSDKFGSFFVDMFDRLAGISDRPVERSGLDIDRCTLFIDTIATEY